MAAYNFHREILEEPANATEAEICSIHCDSLQNPTGGCVAKCASICPYLCNISDSSPPPQSPPPLPTGGFILSTSPPKHHHSPLSLPLKISLVILVVTFSLFLLYTLYKFYTVWYRSRRRRSPPPSPENQETHGEFLDHDVLDHPIWYIRTIGLQPSVISAITVVKYSKTDGLIEDTNCSVCLSEFQEDETLRLLPKCNHAFHISCIDTWLRSHTNCPLCRAGIVKNTPTSSSDQNLGDSGRTEETQLAISIPEEVNGEERQSEVDRESSELRTGVVDEEEKGEMIGGSGTSDFLIMRRSVSLDDYAACRISSDVRNNYYSDRHEVQIQSVNGDLGFGLIKVEQTANNRSTEEN
ncbi:RING-H2 finger protein ATL54 [Lactuca sativa]|uniref:RING-type E3 ubiquitin transferase n=1 Tax=Lactuca sativa TaxID=4236 RepID=A0A9R1VLD1_LACSA|nr:RING-H2 finger protein ATL54 [Lactuca sativa]KAJ0207419.1 hypothetical protein LSAT_V11C500267980 [Lactuca sativa]